MVGSLMHVLTASGTGLMHKAACRCAFPRCGACPGFSLLHSRPLLALPSLASLCHYSRAPSITIHSRTVFVTMQSRMVTIPRIRSVAAHAIAYSAPLGQAGRAPLVGRAWAAKSQRGEIFPLLTPLTASCISFYDFQPLENRMNM